MAQDTAPSYHYAVIARAIALIEAEGSDLPLPMLAARLGMSEAHFQRIFSQWVGVSPKRYQQYLSLTLARRLLAERACLPEVAEATGLSAPSRLHDLFVRWEAMTPGAYARAGRGLTIRWGWFDSAFGPVIAMATDRGLCGMGFAAEMGREAAFDDLARRWPEARLQEARDEIATWVKAALGQSGPTPLHLIGAPFQIKVWEALLSIPSGHVTTYGDIAAAIGQPRAVRAVGTAVGRNPISLLIPCHRALRRDGALGGYHWGLGVKRAILAHEAARDEAAREDAGADDQMSSPCT